MEVCKTICALHDVVSKYLTCAKYIVSFVTAGIVQ